jgi:hypothetical protein
MKLFRLSMIIAVFMLTGILDHLIGAIPLALAAGAVASGLLGLTGLAQWRERDNAPKLARIHLTK